MGLLHKNLILAGIASVAMVGFLGSSSASALDGFSFSDVINNYRNQAEQLQSYLTNHSGTSTDCEVANPDSTISCNKSSFPSLLFNEGEVNSDIWGHDGKGNIFTDANKYINNDPRLIAAAKGDELHFSLVINSKRYLAGDATDPVKSYSLAAILSPGLDFDASTIELEIDGETVPDDAYVTHAEDASSMVAGAKIIGVEIAWRNDDFIYPENAVIEMRYSATVNDEATGEVYSNGICAIRTETNKNQIYPSGNPYTSSEYRAKAMLDGNILIRRVGADGNPLAGAKYTVDGVKANVEDEANNIYVYDENGDVTEFTTDSEGKVIIKNAPMGEYTVREVQAPQGHETKEPVITSPIYENISESEFGRESYMMDYFGMATIDIADLIEDISGTKVLEAGNMLSRVDEALGMSGVNNEEAIAELRPIFTFDASSNTYKRPGTATYIEKDGDGYRIRSSDNLNRTLTLVYDENMDRYVGKFSNSDVDDGLRGWYLDFNGTNVSVRLPDNDLSGTTINLSYDESDECYHGYTVFNNNSYATKLCQNSSGYSLYIDSDTLLIPQLMHFEHDEQTGKYTSDSDIAEMIVLEELSSSEVQLFQYYPIIYDEQQGQYFISLSGFGFRKLDVSRQSILASEFLFQDKTAEAVPEYIANPQTSDAVLKAIIIAGIGLAPIFILRKQLTKRAN